MNEFIPFDWIFNNKTSNMKHLILIYTLQSERYTKTITRTKDPNQSPPSDPQKEKTDFKTMTATNSKLQIYITKMMRLKILIFMNVLVFCGI